MHVGKVVETFPVNIYEHTIAIVTVDELTAYYFTLV
jgi:hypothetical protein